MGEDRREDQGKAAVIAATLMRPNTAQRAAPLLGSKLPGDRLLLFGFFGVTLEPDRQSDQLPVGRLSAFGADAGRAARLLGFFTQIFRIGHGGATRSR